MDAEVFEKKEYVACMGKLEVFSPIWAMEVRRDDKTHTKPMGIESSKNISFQGQEWEMYMQAKVCNELISMVYILEWGSVVPRG